ncbi:MULTISPECIES: CHASE2 domain-containing protein [unclassified Massilia]|uniref:CHASE2 domain-containing protein n=1 Tax=unclassified Massilia TaxID=2609279 RepID=UPI00177FC419|nr:CHASE2 domain-containing protein [Massilia sp. CFBP 13647]MBD8673131.1 CHASE2 domain-containing protein [Massilia sp. CFBP 13721]
MYAPIAGAQYGEGRRDDIRVLLIDDAALAAAGQVWPARYGYSARLLGAIAHYKPKAIFVDIYFSAQRDDPSFAALNRALCALRREGIAVFLASARDGSGNYPLRPELDALAGKCFDKVAIQYTPDDIDRIAWNYPLVAERAGQGAAPLRSAALALHEAASGRALAAVRHPLALTWGSYQAGQGTGWRQDAGPNVASYCRPWSGFAELLPPGIRGLWYEDTDKPLCVYHETLHAGDLANTTTEGEAQLRRQIEGKLVLVGLGTTNSGDFVQSPLHGRIPGIYLHAMALDNLLVDGDDHARHMSMQPGREQAPLVAFLGLSILFVTIVPKLLRPWVEARFGTQLLEEPVEFWMARLRLRRTEGVQWGALLVLPAVWLIRVAGVLVAGYTMIWAGQRFFGLGVLSVVGVIFMTLFAEWFDLNEKLRRHLLLPPAVPQSAIQPVPITVSPEEPVDDVPTPAT